MNSCRGLDVLSRFAPDFFSIYIEGVDIVQHKFWQFHHAKGFDLTWIPGFFSAPVLVNKLSKVVDEAYIQSDALIGRFLERADEKTTIILVSDHGFLYNSQEHWFAPPGVFLLYGNNIIPYGTLEGPSVYDIAPTILYLAGLPVGKDMARSPIL